MPSRLVRLVRAGRIHWFPTTLVRSRCHGPSHANFPRADAVRRRSGLRLVRTLLRRSFVSPSITLTPFYPSQLRARSLSHSGCRSFSFSAQTQPTFRLVPSPPPNSFVLSPSPSFVRPSLRWQNYPLFERYLIPFRGWILPLGSPPSTGT